MAVTPWSHKLSTRMNNVPLVIVGPILRRTKNNSVSVFLALKESKSVTLNIYSRNGDLKFSGTNNTTSLGNKLHVVVVTASTNQAASLLQPNEVYKYDIEFDSPSTTLGSNGVLSVGGNGLHKITYTPDNLPTFSLPPSNIEHLRILQASCRKPHGEKMDAFSGINEVIEESITLSDYTTAIQRPHQLYLTGDQIYADDVADAMLFMIKDAIGELFQWEENLPGVSSNSQYLGYGNRSWLIWSLAKFSRVDVSESTNQARKNHLVYLTEFFSMYLFTWSPELWPEPNDFPSYNNIDTFTGSSEFNDALINLKLFRASLAKVRKVLANIPTYMMFDDHEITDDWYLNLRWSNEALSSNLGKRIIQNGLTAFAVFQAWGNTSWRFDDSNESGWKLLYNLNQNNTSNNFDGIVPGFSTTTYWDRFGQLTGLPSIVSDGFHKRLVPNSQGIKWDFTLEFPYFQVIVLDTRTMREYPKNIYDGYPNLLSRYEGLEQLNAVINSSNYEFHIIVSPAPVIGVPRVEWWQKDFTGLTGSDRVLLAQRDAEAWGLQEIGLERFLGKIGDVLPSGRVVLLSGDVHYSYGARMEQWATSRYGSQSTIPSNVVMAQLTSSSLHNETGGVKGTLDLHTIGWRRSSRGKEEALKVLGFQNPNWQKLTIGKYPEFNPDTGQYIDVSWKVFDNPAITKISKEREVRTAPIGNLTLIQNPAWQYRIDYYSDNSIEINPLYAGPFNPNNVNPPSQGDRSQALSQYLAAAENSSDYNTKWGNGKEIVGVNNFGEISFEWGSGEWDKYVVFNVWWRLRANKNLQTVLAPFPLTKLKIRMGKNLSIFPKPENDLN